MWALISLCLSACEVGLNPAGADPAGMPLSWGSDLKPGPSWVYKSGVGAPTEQPCSELSPVDCKRIWVCGGVAAV